MPLAHCFTLAGSPTQSHTRQQEKRMSFTSQNIIKMQYMGVYSFVGKPNWESSVII